MRVSARGADLMDIEVFKRGDVVNPDTECVYCSKKPIHVEGRLYRCDNCGSTYGLED